MIYSEFKRDIHGNPYLSGVQNLCLTNVMRAERHSVAPTCPVLGNAGTGEMELTEDGPAATLEVSVGLTCIPTDK